MEGDLVGTGCGPVWVWSGQEESTDAARHAPAWENDMVAIPGGTFWMGAGEDSLKALPRNSGPSCDVVALSDGCP